MAFVSNIIRRIVWQFKILKSFIFGKYFCLLILLCSKCVRACACVVLYLLISLHDILCINIIYMWSMLHVLRCITIVLLYRLNLKPGNSQDTCVFLFSTGSQIMLITVAHLITEQRGQGKPVIVLVQFVLSSTYFLHQYSGSKVLYNDLCTITSRTAWRIIHVNMSTIVHNSIVHVFSVLKLLSGTAQHFVIFQSNFHLQDTILRVDFQSKSILRSREDPRDSDIHTLYVHTIYIYTWSFYVSFAKVIFFKKQSKEERDYVIKTQMCNIQPEEKT